MDETIEHLRAGFFDDAADLVGDVERGVLALERGDREPATVDRIFRAVHSLKGAARTFEYDELGAFAHRLEDLLNRVRDGSAPLTPSLLALLLRGSDTLQALVAAARTNTPAPAALAEVAAQLEATRAGTTTAALRTVDLGLTASPEAFAAGCDPADALRALATLGTVVETVADTGALPALDALDPGRCYLSWRVRLQTAAADDVLRAATAPAGVELAWVRTTPPAGDAGRASATAAPAETPTVRVAADKIDGLIDLMGELVIAQSMLSHLFADWSPERMPQVLEALDDLRRNTRALHERIMTVRMVPIDTLFARCPRLVRDLAQELGRELRLRVRGGGTEIDKVVVDQLADPLMHLLRNAADHGIEPPAARQAAGKPAPGTIRVHAYHQGGQVVIDVEDDGRGLDAAAILAKARERGLVGAEETPPDAALHALIFAAGFSTARTVSAVSGRGVGMDVVRRNIEGLGGTIAIQSTPGSGTRFRIRLPLTLAIIETLSVRVGDAVVLIPLVAVCESIRVRACDLDRVGERWEAAVRGERLPLLALHDCFGLPPSARGGDALVVVVQHESTRVGLLVDQLLGQQQVVVKSVERHYRKVDGVGGATILGEGTVALIVDVAGLVARVRADEPAAPPTIHPFEPTPATEDVPSCE